MSAPDNIRELLALAAKAAGIKHDGVGYVSKTGLPINWRPHEDDGESRWLEVAMFFTVAIRRHEVEVFDEDGECLSSVPVAPGEDHASATRFAVLHAAAEIGRGITC